nr:hypothetical protein Iba_chr12aCG3980 [Ipomoea batatas]
MKRRLCTLWKEKVDQILKGDKPSVEHVNVLGHIMCAQLMAHIQLNYPTEQSSVTAKSCDEVHRVLICLAVDQSLQMKLESAYSNSASHQSQQNYGLNFVYPGALIVKYAFTSFLMLSNFRDPEGGFGSIFESTPNNASNLLDFASDVACP